MQEAQDTVVTESSPQCNLRQGVCQGPDRTPSPTGTFKQALSRGRSSGSRSGMPSPGGREERNGTQKSPDLEHQRETAAPPHHSTPTPTKCKSDNQETARASSPADDQDNNMDAELKLAGRKQRIDFQKYGVT
ncbi:hypothetical protein R1flu_007415 [Riccia fluitans]|uniref:Uncharacterized protein n=1 Tax=Riccia fluitans TaxID=41844 RepID=A0ABD1YYV6_9MARC